MKNLRKLPSVFYANNIVIFLTILISIPRIVNAQGDNPSRYIPPPLPEREWVGKTSLNYTELHSKYSEVLTCLYIPTGVLGYFWWFSASLMEVICVVKCMIPIIDEGERQKPTSLLHLPSGIFTFARSIYSIIAGFKTLNGCSDLSGFSAVRSYIIMNLAAAIISTIGGLLFTFRLCKPIELYFLGTAVVFHHIALDLQLFSGPVLFFSVTKSAGILGKIMKKPDLVRVGATIASILVTEIFVIPIAVGMFMATGPLAVITVPLAAVAIAMSGTSNVLLGKIMGDPSGRYLLDMFWGKFTASMTALGPIIEAILFGLGQAFGGTT